jgi:glyoxylase-like metal-dependent hydrolase (beta-lactamase superfamily II)
MLNVPKPTLAVVTVLVSSGSFSADAQTVGPVIRPTSVHVTVLSTMLAEARGIGEWGFAAFLEVDGRRFLIDSGARPETVLRNSEELGVDLSTVTDVVLTHHHGDHTGGLVVLRRELAKKNPRHCERRTSRQVSSPFEWTPADERETVCFFFVAPTKAWGVPLLSTRNPPS